ncbi:MAG: hypothetical protein WAL13_25240 [Trebonia sp.]
MAALIAGWVGAFLDPRREQVHDLDDADRAQVRPAGRRVDPAEISLEIELRQRVPERRGGRVGRQRSGSVLGEIAALRAFRVQLDGHVRPG